MFFKIIQYTVGILIVISALLISASYFSIIDIRIVESGSMEPAIKTGSVVIIKKVGNYNVGNVITYNSKIGNSKPTTHRIVNERIVGGNTLFTTKGDANEDTDVREVREEEVLGKVFFSVPYFGYLIDFIRRPQGLTVFIGISALLVIIGEIVNIRRKK